MDFSAKLDDLQQRAADAKAAAQAAVSESHEQLRQRIDQARVDLDLAAMDARQQVGEAGVAPMAWLTDARIDRARVLLETTTEPIENIGRLTGLGAPASVRAAFHRRIGTSPKEYRAVFHHRAPTSA